VCVCALSLSLRGTLKKSVLIEKDGEYVLNRPHEKRMKPEALMQITNPLSPSNKSAKENLDVNKKQGAAYLTPPRSPVYHNDMCY
jgi:hypothetical protein